MGYSDLYFWYMVVGKINTFLFWIIGITLLISFVFYIISACKYDKMEDEDGKKFCFKGIKMSILSIIFIFISIAIPNTGQFLSYVSLKTVDNYAKNHPDSISNPQIVLKTADDIANLSIKLVKSLDKSIDIVDKKIDKLSK